jgi:predicted Zn-dependent protease
MPCSTLTKLAFGLVAVLIMQFGGGCATNAATGRSQLNLLDTETEIQMGLDAKPQVIAEYGGEYPDPDLQAYVSSIGFRLAEVTEGPGPEFPWSFTVLNSEVINAFALPGGQVFITRGLLQLMDNEAQLAGVLGHEVGHAVAEHGDERISQQLIFMGILTGVAIASSESDDELVQQGVPLLVGVGGQGFLLKYSRSHEHEADKLGVRYMVRCGYDPMGQVQVMEILADAAGGERSPEFLSTHPHPENRIERLRTMIREQYPGTQNNPDFGLYAERFRKNVKF